MTQKKPLVLDSSGNTQQLQAGDSIDVTMGGTGAVTPAAARINLGLIIGTNVQAWSTNLDALAALATNGMISRTAAGAYSARTLVAPAAGITIANPDGVAGNQTFALANDLAALEGLAGTGFGVRTGTDAWAQRTLTVQPRLTVTNPDGSGGNPLFDLAAVTDVGGGNFRKFVQDAWGRVTGTSAVTAADLTALLSSIYLGLAGGTMQGPLILSADPSVALGAVTKQYVDAIAGGQVDKPSVRLLVNTAITVANPGTAVFDSVTANVGDRLFLIAQTSQAENGPWIFNGSGVALTRPTDWATSANIIPGSTFYVEAGTQYQTSVWSLLTQAPYNLGTTALTFTQTNGLGDIGTGNGLTKVGNTISAVVAPRLVFTSGQIDLASGVVTAGTGTKLTVNTYGQVTGVTNAVPSDIGAQPASTELTGLAALSANGSVTRTAAGTYAVRTLQAPAAGMTIAFPDGVGGNPAFAFANDLAALEALSGTGIAVRTGTDTWVQRLLAVASAGRLVLTNADGVAGNITLDLAASGITPGTYQSITVDTYGRVTAGVTIANLNTPGATLLNDDTTTNVQCTPVYIDSAGGFKRAVANSAATSDVFGLCFADIVSGASGIVATSGELTATTAQWDAVTGQTGGLTFGATYFLDPTTAGKITSTAPSSGFLIPIGKAESTTKMTVRIGTRIQL